MYTDPNQKSGLDFVYNRSGTFRCKCKDVEFFFIKRILKLEHTVFIYEHIKEIEISPFDTVE